MTTHLDSQPPPSGRQEPSLEALPELVWASAQIRQRNSTALLELLRLLESLHREICETLFQESLPDNYQDLIALLSHIEETGGWPYIYRMKLRDFMNKLVQEEQSDQPSQQTGADLQTTAL